MRAETRDHEKRKIYTKENYKWKQEIWLKKAEVDRKKVSWTLNKIC